MAAVATMRPGCGVTAEITESTMTTSASTRANQVSHGVRRTTLRVTPSTTTPNAVNSVCPAREDSMDG